jgi:amino acid adenylation domain-containing protein
MRLARLSEANRNAVLAQVRSRSEAGVTPHPVSGVPPIARASRTSELPLSFAQERLWFLDQFRPGSAFYNIPAAIHIRGVLDIEALNVALRSVVLRHETLRTTFPVENGRPYQHIDPDGHCDLACVDLSLLPVHERPDACEQVIAEQARCPFNLATGPLLRTRLVRLDSNHHVLIAVIHHIVSDGWSMGIVVRELNECYRAHVERRPAALPSLRVQYADYAVWQRQWLQGAALESQLSYWRESLRDVSPLSMPSDRPRPALMRYQGGERNFQLSRELAVAVAGFCGRESVTPFMFLMGVCQVVVARHSEQTDFCIGTPIANRRLPEVEPLVGFFVNTLAIRADLSGDPSMRDVVQRVRRRALAAYAHQDAPFEQVVDALGVQRDVSRTPIFQVMFVLQNAPVEGLRLGSAAISIEPIDTGSAKFDLLLSIEAREDGLRGSLQYSTDLFDDDFARRFIERYRRVLECAIAEPDRSVFALPWTDDADTRLVRRFGSGEVVAYSEDLCVHHLVEGQARQTPSRVAVEDDESQLTYEMLDSRAVRLADRLERLGIGPGTRVGVLLERSTDLPVAILAVMKAGAAYLPLDPTYPDDRLRFMLDDGNVAVCLAHRHLTSRALGDRCYVRVDDDDFAAFDSCTRSIRGEVTPDALAYVIYTSGSTGRPKGVAMSHRPLRNLLEWQRAFIESSGRQAAARTLQFASVGFDVSFQEIFSALSTGGTVVMLKDEVRRDPRALLRMLAARRVERVFLPFVVLSQLAEHATAMEARGLHVRELITAGEQLRISDALRRLIAEVPGLELHNQYGPTESHVVTVYRMTGDPRDWPALPPIGSPIANTQIYVLDGRGQLTPPGVPGELCIGGAALAQGYWARPDLTADRFMPDPFVHRPDAVMYRTGDRARWNEQGQLEYLGRSDQQVKIRGHRIELGEVETVLASHAKVSSCAVDARADAAGQQQLVAYVVPRSGSVLDRADVRDFLKERLPEPMIPAVFITVDALPVSANGKLNRSALPAVAWRWPADGAVEPPATPVEHLLVELFAEVLGVDTVGVSDDFFDFGGNSMLAVALVSRIRSRLSPEFPVASLFQARTVRSLAHLLEQRSEPSPLVVLKAGATSVMPLVCVHPAGGHVFCYRALVREIQTDRVCLGLQLTSMSDGRQSIAALAHMYADVLITENRTPCHLLGWSFGGVLAMEIAASLERRHQPVASVILLDSVSPDAVATAVRARPSDVERLASRFVESAFRHEWPQSMNAKDREEINGLYAASAAALLDHHATPVHAPVALVRAAENIGEMRHLAKRTPTYGWAERIAPQTTLHESPGTHFTMIEVPHTAHLASLIDEITR